MEENESLHFPQEMLDMFAEISRQQEAQVRQCKTMLAGFKATGETDLGDARGTGQWQIIFKRE